MTIKISFDNPLQSQRTGILTLGQHKLALPNVILAPQTVEKLGIGLVQRAGLIANVDTFAVWQAEKQNQQLGKVTLSRQGAGILMATDPLEIAAGYAKPRGIKKDIVRFRLDPQAQLQSLTPEEAVQLQLDFSNEPMIVSLPTQLPDYFAPKDLIDAAAERTINWTKQAQSVVGNNLVVVAWQGAGLKRSRQQSLQDLLQVASPKAIAIQGVFQNEPLSESQRLLPELVQMLQNDLPNALRITTAPANFDQLQAALKSGIDLATTAVPTDFAEQGLVMTGHGPKAIDDYIGDEKPLDPKCNCPVCQNMTASEVASEVSLQWPAGKTHLAIHNLFALNQLMACYRNSYN